MPTASTLVLTAYNLATGAKAVYSDQVMELEMDTIAPGGYGTMTCKVRVKDARIVPPELRLMANVAVMSGRFAVFLGRWDEPAIALQDGEGDYFELHAMGAAHCLSDEPADSTYSNQTAQFIIGQELSSRSAYLPLDQDTSQILPNNPSATFSPAFNTKTIEEKINEINPLLGDYTWGVWNHPTHRDAAGFPAWQLYWHVRDASTIAYTGYLVDEASYTIRPSVEYSYNAVQIKFRDATSDLPSSVTVKDSRLNNDNSQGNAPFPYRKLVKDLSYTHLSATEAAALANALLALYQNGGFKVEMDLEQVRNANGNLIPLATVRADANIFLPELSPFGTTITTTPKQGVNVFYIQETRYSEAGGSTPKLTISANSFFDGSAFQVARMQYIHEHLSKDGKVHHTVRAAGEQETGRCGMAFGTNSLAGDVWECGVNYKTATSTAPTSITLTGDGAPRAPVNISTTGVASITNTGFQLQLFPAANGAGRWSGSYQTVGA